MTNCLIDSIVKKEKPAFVVYEDSAFIAFLDIHPLFYGHTLLAPKDHYQTLYDVPHALIPKLFLLTQLLGKAIEKAMIAEGSFIAMNNTISQSIPHLHVHIVPRNKKDGLKGFFWPRRKYLNEEEKKGVQNQIIAEMTKLCAKNFKD